MKSVPFRSPARTRALPIWKFVLGRRGDFGGGGCGGGHPREREGE